jgi:transcriptional regulator with XRE-family HTH domain
MSTEIVAVDGNTLGCYFPWMTPEQCRAARGWLDLSQEELGKAAGVSLSTVRDFEKGRRTPIAATLGAMRVALERQGIGFVMLVDGAPCGITFAKRGDADH